MSTITIRSGSCSRFSCCAVAAPRRECSLHTHTRAHTYILPENVFGHQSCHVVPKCLVKPSPVANAVAADVCLLNAVIIDKAPFVCSCINQASPLTVKSRYYTVAYLASLDVYTHMHIYRLPHSIYQTTLETKTRSACRFNVITRTKHR